MPKLRNFICGFSMVLAATASSQGTGLPEHTGGQSIADEIRIAAGADIALFPNAYLREVKGSKELLTLIEHPEDAVWLVTISGRQIRAGLEKSIAYFPQASASFLHVSGISIQFGNSKSERIDSITIDNAPLDSGKIYKVAMPASLARGGLGYFGIWEFQKPERVVSSNLTKLLDGKLVQYSVARWQFKGSL